jgi:ParB-like chromosome segregation protein Spo0J
MNKRLQPATKSTKDAAIYAALAAGAETHQAIADRLGCSRVHVSRVAAEHRADLDAAASLTMKAAIDGPAKARQMASDATPRAIEVAIEIMDADPADPSAANVRLAAAKTVMDRGGVPVRTEIDATISADPERLARLRALLGAKGE